MRTPITFLFAAAIAAFPLSAQGVRRPATPPGTAQGNELSGNQRQIIREKYRQELQSERKALRKTHQKRRQELRSETPEVKRRAVGAHAKVRPGLRKRVAPRGPRGRRA